MRRVLLISSWLGLLLSTAVHGAEVLRLNSRDWQLNNGNGSISLQTTVPAYPLEVLRAHGVIADPLYRLVPTTYY